MIRNVFRFVVWGHLRSRPLRACLAATGVLLGVALFVGIGVINRSTLASYRESIESLAGRTSLTISAGPVGFDEARLEVVRRVPGVAYAVPLIESQARWKRPDGSSEPLLVLGVDLLEEHSVWETEDGEKVVRNALSFLNQPDSIILTRAFARRYGLERGSTLELETVRGRERFTVRGVLAHTRGPGQAYGGNVAVMDIDAARLAFGKPARIDRIDAVAGEGEELDRLAGRLRVRLGPAFRVERPESQAEGLRRTIRPFQLMMTLFSSLALGVGLFLVAGTVSVSVTERHSEIGLLRALGATRRMVVGAFVLEAAAIGFAGGLAGAAAGLGAARALLAMVSQTLSKQARVPVEVEALRYGAGEFVAVVAMTTAAAALAALVPALRAARVEPAETVGPRGRAHARVALGRALPLAGVVLLGMLELSARLGWGARGRVFAIADPVLGLAGALCLGPWLVLAAVSALAPARLGLTSRLAVQELLRGPRRTAGNAMSLLAGLLLVVLFVTLDASFKDTLIGSYGRAVRPDLMVSTSPDVSDEQAQPMQEEVIARLARLPGVSGAYGMRKIPLEYQGRRVTLKAFDEPDPSIHYGIYEMLDRPIAQAGEELYHGAEPSVFVSETFSKLHGKKTGDRLRLMTPAGELEVRVVGVELAPAVSGGLISMSRALYKRYWHDPLVSVIAVQVPRAADLDDVRRRIEQDVGRELGLAALPQDEVKERIAEVIDRSFRSTRAVEAASLLVGFLGLLNAFFVSMMERRRELGMLRAVGMARAQLYRLVLAEAALLGAAGAAVAVACGGWIARTWILHSLAAELGWTVQFSFPWAGVLATVALGISVTLLASLLPAYRAAHLEIRDAIGHE